MHEISIGRFRNGFCVYWTQDGKRRRYQLKASTRAQAEPEAIDVYQSKTFENKSVDIEHIWNAYIIHLGDRPNAKTLGYTGKAVLPHFGAYRPDQITDALCTEYTDKRRHAGKLDGTIHTELGHLRNALSFAHKRGVIEKKPHIIRPQKPMPKERYLEIVEIKRLIRAAKSPHTKLAIHLLFATAGRVGAILDLTWERVDLERGQINLRVDGAKTRKGRAIVPINSGLKAELQTAYNAAMSDYVVEYAGKQVGSIRKAFERAVKSANLKDVTIHTLRHSAAVHMAASGISLTKVSQYLGHSNVATTYQVYARYAPGHLSDAAEALNLSEIRAVK